MRRSLAILAALAALTGASLAAPALAQEAPAAAPDPERLRLAMKMVELSGGEKQADAQVKAIFAAAQKALGKALPADKAELTAHIYDDLGQEMAGIMPKLLDIGARAYAEVYTEQELKDMIAFQMSESGQAMMKKAPRVRAQIINETMPLIMSAMPGVLNKAAMRACDESHCTADQRKTVTEAMAKAFAPPSS
jgi:hypothetical protein